jgi:hypothetical protein
MSEFTIEKYLNYIFHTFFNSLQWGKGVCKRSKMVLG